MKAFETWIEEKRVLDRDLPVPLVPVNVTRTGDTARGDSWSKRTPTEPVPPPSLNPSDGALVAIPLEACLFDALYRGTLTGKVPDGWSRDGWIVSLRDRLSRVDERDDEKVVTKLLQRELEAIERCENRKRS
jgi:hypothetical protein